MTETNDNHARRWRVSGQVQGVFFRASTRDEAQRLHLTGYARNEPDGSVEVLAVGPRKALDALEEWLADGPRMARVDAVEAEELPPPDPAPGDFSTG
ncbi:MULTISPECIES: acylphosphatase [Thioalkalivibrio]|uniref:Acylphosphatase n=1 Tax=Thioalkalivibrio versutus TaxID=106634 RepID=A0A0G3G5R4_9GAMM|nr:MULTISPECIES: acylphosphatase [Thioalkalivibrio]AKJ95689.1 acylphosphatase [Thioalkalivibrio versutus]OOC49041.1 acylphosphatase [Thioalkalivibrio versutus]